MYSMFSLYLLKNNVRLSEFHEQYNVMKITQLFPSKRRRFIARLAMPHRFCVAPFWDRPHILRRGTVVAHHSPTAATVVPPKEHRKRCLTFHALCDGVIGYPVVRPCLCLFGVV